MVQVIKFITSCSLEFLLHPFFQ